MLGESLIEKPINVFPTVQRHLIRTKVGSTQYEHELAEDSRSNSQDRRKSNAMSARALNTGWMINRRRSVISVSLRAPGRSYPVEGKLVKGFSLPCEGDQSQYVLLSLDTMVSSRIVSAYAFSKR